MDIEEFYDADPRRRASEEVEFGREWTDAERRRYEIVWVADTGDVYAMFEPVEPIASDGIGDIFVQHMPTDAVTVEVLAVVADREDLDRRFDGWESAMPELGSITWVHDRLAQA